jgi:uncharacterized protein (TIGR03382 family)
VHGAALLAIALAQVQFYDDFEDPALSPGWTVVVNTPEADSGWLVLDGGGRPTDPRSLRFFDGTRGTGTANFESLRYAFDGGTSQYLRAWVRVAGDGGNIGIMQLNVTGSPIATICDMELNGAGNVLSSAYNNAGAGTASSPAVNLAQGGWGILELQAEGIGTANGRCLAWTDGVLLLDAGVNLSGLDDRDVTLGEPFGARAFAGTLDFDDVAVAPLRPSTAVVWSGPNTLVTGQCTHFGISLYDPAELATTVRMGPTSGTLTFTGAPVIFGQSPTCPTAVTQFTVPAGSSSTDVYVMAVDAGVTVLRANPATEIPGSYAVLAVIGMDAGTDAEIDAGTDGGEDAGTDAGADAGTPPPEMSLGLGCGCQDSPDVAPLLAALCAWLWRRKALRQPLGCATPVDSGPGT